MTVCVAAICGPGTVFGASDRMLTAGDVQFEPTQPKIWQLTTSIAVMVAGDSSLQVEILQAVGKDVKTRIEAEPTNWWMVKDAAELYSQHYCEIRCKRSQRTILSRFGLDHGTFISRQQQMSEVLVRQLATELIKFSMPSVSAIFAGVDPAGTHIYVADDANIECLDTVGFAAIGIGRWHANSQFMFAEHDGRKPYPETLLLTYAAKKRAEVSPGVGEGTDMFAIGPFLGSYINISPEAVDELERMYQATREEERKASVKANREVNRFFEKLLTAASAKEQEIAPKESGGNPPANQERIRNVAEESKPEDEPCES